MIKEEIESEDSDNENKSDVDDDASVSSLSLLEPIEEYDFNTDVFIDPEHLFEPTSSSSAASNAHSNRLNAKSKEVYEHLFKRFTKWRRERYIDGASEKVVLAYLEEESKKVNPSSLWLRYYMLKSMLSERENVDINQYQKLIPYLKRKNKDHTPKKLKGFTKEQVDRFMTEAPDQAYLLMKVALVFGICGGLRRDELVKLKTADIQDVQAALIVTVLDIKTQTQKTFTISDPSYIQLYRKYLALLPPERDNDRFFYNYAEGKCSKQVVGVNQFGKIPCIVAKYLGLPESEEYTGHCFRLSSTMGFRCTAQQNLQPDMLVKDASDGKPARTVVDNVHNETITATITDGFTMNNCSNCVINLYVVNK